MMELVGLEKETGRQTALSLDPKILSKYERKSRGQIVESLRYSTQLAGEASAEVTVVSCEPRLYSS